MTWKEFAELSRGVFVSVAAEEFGIVLCLLLVALFAFIVLRGLIRLHDQMSSLGADDPQSVAGILSPKLLLAFADETKSDPRIIERAQHALSGRPHERDVP